MRLYLHCKDARFAHTVKVTLAEDSDSIASSLGAAIDGFLRTVNSSSPPNPLDRADVAMLDRTGASELTDLAAPAALHFEDRDDVFVALRPSALPKLIALARLASSASAEVAGTALPAPPAALKQPNDPVVAAEVSSSIAAASSGGAVLASTGGKTVAADKRTVERSLVIAAQYMAARQFRKAREIYHLLTLSSAENLEALEQVWIITLFLFLHSYVSRLSFPFHAAPTWRCPCLSICCPVLFMFIMFVFVFLYERPFDSLAASC